MFVAFSRLSPNLDRVIGDPLLLSYFVRFLCDNNSENLFRFWLELSGLIEKTKSPESCSSASGEVFTSLQQFDILRDRVTQLPITTATSVYFRYLSKEAKLAVDLPIELLCRSLTTLLENPQDILCFLPCLRFAEICLNDELLPHFLQSKLFAEFRIEIVTNGQLQLDDVIFNEELLVYFVEFLANSSDAVLFTFLLAVNAYRMEYKELFSCPNRATDFVNLRYEELLDDATTICAKYLSPASDNFMNLNLELYQDALDKACTGGQPNINCFDPLYDHIHKRIEKNVLPGFFTSAPFLRYCAIFSSKADIRPSHSFSKRASPTYEQQCSTLELDVTTLNHESLSYRLPDLPSKKFGLVSSLELVTKMKPFRPNIPKKKRKPFLQN